MRLLGLIFCGVLLTGCLGSASRPLQLLSGAGPIYPPQARADGIEGEVTVRYQVSAEGVVQNPVVVASEPAGVFDSAALIAVRSWQYAAPVQDGQRVAVPRVNSVLRFRLDETPDYLDND